MTRKIAITLRKGGSGKTTTAVNLAAGLRQLGQRVLLVDLDPQANATLAVGINPLALPYNINHLFTSIDVRPRDAIHHLPTDLDLLPSHPDLGVTETSMKASQVGVLRGMLQAIEDDYDFIILDTPPSESFLAINALAYADEVIIPLQAHYLAVHGLEQAMEQIENVRQGLNPSLRISGILPTMVNQRTNIARMILDDVREKYPTLVYPFQIDFSIKHAEASLAGLPVVLFEPNSTGAQAYRKLAETVLHDKQART
ncbi:ParA family protein [Streptacidiphilus cavernicola]|uniref:ParA family protein n=1 Tax=Streptacidiphilus cavernicola TaxID=3342716 RepID=A0ABV6W0S3_9ACTN